MNLKTLRKKIRKLETRLQEGPQKLARLKRKLEAMTKAKAEEPKEKPPVGATAAARQPAKAEKPKEKPAVRAKARRPAKASSPTQKKKARAKAQPAVKAAGPQIPSSPRKAKRKLNLSPERRAQLAAAMKARWAAKRAAADGNPQQTLTNRNSASGDASQAS